MRAWASALAVLLILPWANAQAPLADVFPSHDEVTQRMAALAERQGFDILQAGTTIEGRELWLAVVTDPTSAVPMHERVVTLLLTQQHGNEPAGTPAALALLDEIADGGPAAAWLHNQVLLVQPMGNPDGATAGQRANAQGTDLNRDHVHLVQPETQAVHRLFQDWDIHVGVDHHEYSGTGLGYPVPVRTYDYDLTTLFPRHGNVRTPTLAAAQGLMYDGMWPAAEAAGYTINEYGEQTVAGIPIDHVAGGPDPGILRNNFGLNNIAGILVESFVPVLPNPFVDAERREAVHRVLMDATLQYASQNAAALIAAKREAERLNVEEPLPEYVEADADDPLPLPLDGVDDPIRAPLATAYQVPAPNDRLMALHGLPPATVTDEGSIYSLLHPRAGLLAAILHPESTRTAIAGATPATAPLQEAAVEPASRGAPATPALLAALGLVAAVAARRRCM